MTGPDPGLGHAGGWTVGTELRPRGRELRLVVALFVAMLVSTFPEFALGVLAPLLVDELAIGEATIGAVASLLYLTAAVLARVAGPHLDEVSSRTALTVLYGAALGAVVILAASRSVPWLLAAALLGGASLAINNPITSRFIVAAVEPGRRGLSIGLKQIGVKVGQMLAGAAIPLAEATLGWRAGLGVFAAVGVVLLAGSLPLVPAVAGDGLRPATSVGAARSQVGWLRGFAVAMAVGQSAITTYLALYGVQQLGLGLAEGGLLVTAFASTAVVARLVWVTAAERLAHPSTALVLLSAGAVASSTTLMAATVIGPVALWVGAVLGGATFGSWNVVVQLAVLAEVEPTRTASATGAVQSSFMLGMGVGAPAFGLLVEGSGSYAVAWSVAVLLAASAFVTAWRQRSRHRGATPGVVAGDGVRDRP